MAEANKSLNNIKSIFILKRILEHLTKNIYFNIIKYNKRLQNKCRLGIKDYKDLYEKIIIEIVPKKEFYNEDNEYKDEDFINIQEKNKPYFHTYFVDNKSKNEKKEDNKMKIRVVLDYQINSFEGLFKERIIIEKINFIQFVRKDIKDMSEMFLGCTSLKEIIFSNFKTNKVNNMSKMFYGCSSLSELDLSKFNTSNVKYMSYMFYECSLLNKLNLSSFNTNEVSTMDYMFNRCLSLKELNLSCFKTKNVTYMSCMFSGCSSLEILNISNFNTNKVTTMKKMFYECSALKELDLSNFNTEKVTNMKEMFYGCSCLKKLNISNFISNNADMNGMFSLCSKDLEANVLAKIKNDKK